MGCGNIGSFIAKDLAEHMPSTDIVIADRLLNKAKEVAATIGKENVTAIQLDVRNYNELVKTIKRFDLVVGALPGKFGYRSMKATIDANVDMVDISSMPEDPLTLNEDAVKAGVTIIPYCGAAPGLTNILVGHAVSKLDEVENVHIMVGGLPAEPVPPLGYIVTWSIEDLIADYVSPAKIVENGRIVEVDALSGLEEVEFPGVGKLEAFYTDGLTTLLYTIKPVKSMWEKTLRYPGHAEKIKLLRELGFFDEQPINIDDVNVSPRKVTAKLLEKKLRRPEIRDIFIMKVEVSGVKENSKICYVYQLLDRYKDGVTAMARTTGYPTSIIAQLVVQKVIKEKGVIPPEKLGAKEEIFEKILAELENRQVKIVESVLRQP